MEDQTFYEDTDTKFSKFIKPQTIEKPSKITRRMSMKFGSEVFMVIGAIDLCNVESAKSLALQQWFIQQNEEFVKSGDLIRLCLEKGFMAFAQDLVKAGYFLPSDILIKAIKKSKHEAVRNIITGKFYPQTGFELEYWYLLHKGLYAYAEIMRIAEPQLQVFQIEEHNYDQEVEILEIALKRSLERGYDDFACIIMKINPMVVNAEMIRIAMDQKNMDFLRRIWTGNQEDNFAFNRIKRMQISRIWNNLNVKTDGFRKQEVANIMKIGNIIRSLLTREYIQEARKVITWPEAADDKDILKVCVEMGEEEIGRDVIAKRTRDVTQEDFKYCLSQKFYWLALDMLKWNEPLRYLYNKDAQKEIVELLRNGSTCYFAAEMFARIEPSLWDSSNTETVCEIVNLTMKKNFEFYKCPHPMLFLVLMAEFLLKISHVNIYHATLCRETANSLILLAKCVEDNIDEENELKYFMLCQDTQCRTVLTIIAMNNFFSLLENNDVGSIVNNMWIGDRKNEGIINASTLYTSFFAPDGSERKLIFFNNMDSRQAYMFQYDQLVSSCKLRFFGQMISIAFLVFFYSMMVELAHVENTLDNFAAGKNTQVFLRLSQIWIVGIFLEKVITIIFCAVTKRKIIKDVWLFIDFFMFVMMIFLMAGVNQYYAGDGKWLNFISSSDFNALMHAVVLCLVWLKLFSILTITESYGPLLRIMYIMTIDMMTFLLVYFSALFIGAVIMTTLFCGLTTSDKFSNFGTSFQTLYRIGLGDFKITDYTNYLAFGAVLESLLVVLTNIMLFNILIAILTVTYERENEGEESKYRSTLIKAYYKWRWDDNYGLLILMPSPITIFITTVLPLLLGVRNSSRITNLFSKLFFLLFVLPMFCYFASVSAIFIPLVYLTSLDAFAKGGVKTLKPVTILREQMGPNDTESDDDDDVDGVNLGKENQKVKAFSIRRAVIWVLVGGIVTGIAYLRDLLDFWKIIFKDTRVNAFSQIEEEGNIYSNEAFINNVQETLMCFDKDEITVDEVSERYVSIDNSSLSSIVLADKNLMEKRKESIVRFFENMSFSRKWKKIKRKDIIEMLPHKNYYSENYIFRAKHIRVVWIAKALKSFRKTIANINIKGVDIPKFAIMNETYQVRRVMISSKNAKVHLNVMEKNLKMIEEKLEEARKKESQKYSSLHY
ncbi:hypothetical protein SteCoe_36766 [Stentor coeruleus]|uniref:Ion transport domain-containing protein n=1 Tax=Stentor coeruleus TaxID=5963 RepID=A0A1R2APD4_9CILI|nr:hypothetical protein SteCoe_36766 [Stentor coeruleus]